VVKKNPSDKLVQLHFDTCTKIVKKNAFLKAIAIAEPPAADEGLDLDSMVVEPVYDGAELGEEMTQEFIDDMIQRFRDQKTLHRKYVYRIVLKVREILDKEPTMVEVEVPKGHTLTVCGDTHGKTEHLLMSTR
jgi:serine/threonine-protein phosphatase 5